MTITLQNTEKGQCYAVKFDRYRQQVVDKLKSSVSIRWWDKQTGAWLIPATNKCKAELDQLTYYVRHFEPVQWGTIAQSQTEEDVAFQIPEMPELDGEHGLKVQPYPYQLQGIARGLQLKRFINGDDMGLGKQQPVSMAYPVNAGQNICGVSEMSTVEERGKDGSPRQHRRSWIPA